MVIMLYQSRGKTVERLNAASRWMREKGITEILANNSYVDKFHKMMI